MMPLSPTANSRVSLPHTASRFFVVLLFSPVNLLPSVLRTIVPPSPTMTMVPPGAIETPLSVPVAPTSTTFHVATVMSFAVHATPLMPTVQAGLLDGQEMELSGVLVAQLATYQLPPT